MLEIAGALNTVVTDDYRAVELPLAGGELSLLIIIPVQNKFNDVHSHFNRDLFHQVLDSLTLSETSVMLPTFDLFRNVNKKELPDLGIALKEPQADFSAVNNAGFLFLHPPRQSIKFTIATREITSTTTSTIIHQATADEPEWLLPHPNRGNNAGLVITFQPPNDSKMNCFYPPDQLPFLFAIYTKDSQTLLHLGHITKLFGEKIPPDWAVWRRIGCEDNPSDRGLPIDYQRNHILNII